MKKILIMLLTVMMLCSLTACKKEETAEPPVDGGWATPENGEITPELQAMFDKAMEGLAGAGYAPLELVGTQVVAGTNYRFRCEQTIVYPGAQPEEVFVTIYQDLDGNAEVTAIETADGQPVDPAPSIVIPSYTEDMFDMTFDFYDTIDFGKDGRQEEEFTNAYGLWQGVLSRDMNDGSVDRELCFINIYTRGSETVMDITPKIRDEDNHVYETNHSYDTFQMVSGDVPTFQLYGMTITFEDILTDGEHQYVLGRMEIPEINETSTLTMYR